MLGILKNWVIALYQYLYMTDPYIESTIVLSDYVIFCPPLFTLLNNPLFSTEQDAHVPELYCLKKVFGLKCSVEKRWIAIVELSEEWWTKYNVL